MSILVEETNTWVVIVSTSVARGERGTVAQTRDFRFYNVAL